MSEKTTPTASEVNRRIAEFMGYRDIIVSTRWHDMLEGIKPGYRNHEGIPDYMHDASAAIAAAEKLCRERHLKAKLLYDFEHSGVGTVPMVWYVRIDDEWYRSGWRNDDVKHQSLATAISLALFAVLGEGS